MHSARRGQRTVMAPDWLRIGEVAAQAGVHIQTLRFYERRGLLREPDRRPSGYRAYPPETVRLVRFIKHAQELGFTLREVQELLHLREGTAHTCREVRVAAEAKMADIDSKVERLLAMRRALAVLVKSCAMNAEPHCPLLEALDEAHTPPGKGKSLRADRRETER